MLVPIAYLFVAGTILLGLRESEGRSIVILRTTRICYAFLSSTEFISVRNKNYLDLCRRLLSPTCRYLGFHTHALAPFANHEIVLCSHVSPKAASHHPGHKRGISNAGRILLVLAAVCAFSQVTFICPAVTHTANLSNTLRDGKLSCGRRLYLSYKRIWK